MAIVYLATGDTVDLYGAGAIYGDTGIERVLLHEDARNMTVSSTVEDVHFAGSAADYAFSGPAGRLELWKDGERVASLTAARGTELRFADGAASIAVDASSGRVLLGGQALGVEPTDFSGSLDASRPSSNAQHLPANPNAPVMPHVPADPITPANPGAPSAPGDPSTPDAPADPGAPSRPGEPSLPDAPSNPGGPSLPDAPSTPGDPSLPDAPADPGAPSRPGEPSLPDAPSNPDTPATPSTPSTPGGGSEDDVETPGGVSTDEEVGTPDDGGSEDDGNPDGGPAGEDEEGKEEEEEEEAGGGTGDGDGGGGESTAPAPKVPAWLEPGDPITATTPDRLEGRLDGSSFQDPMNIMGIHNGTLSNLSIHDASDVDYFKIRLDSHGTEDNFVTIDFTGYQKIKLWVVPADGGNTINPGSLLANTEKFCLKDLEAGTYVVYVRTYGNGGVYSLSWNTEGSLEFPDAGPADIRTGRSSTFDSGTETSFISTLSGLTADSFPENRLELDGIVDAEKSSANTTDDEMCWAASTSNMLAVTGWGELGLVNRGLRDDKPLEDDIFDLFRDRHEPGGSNVQHGIEWFFAQTGLPSMGLDYRYQGFVDFPQTGYTAPSSRTAIAEIAGALADGGAASLSLAGVAYGQDLAHAVTCYGVRWDTARGQDDPTRFTGLYLADSDNDYVFADPTRAPNALQLVDCSYDADADQWILENYTSWDGDRVILSGFATLNSHPGIAGAQPVTASGVPDADEAAILA